MCGDVTSAILQMVPAHALFKVHIEDVHKSLISEAGKLAAILLFRVVKDKLPVKNCRRLSVLCDYVIKRQMKFNTRV